MKNDKRYTVRELIEGLLKVDQDLEVCLYVDSAGSAGKWAGGINVEDKVVCLDTSTPQVK